MGSKLRTASWVVLAVVGALVLLVSLISASLAYRGDFPVGGVSIARSPRGRDAVLEGLRGARGTSAAWAAAWAVLFLAVVVGPYRRGDVATWWGILGSAPRPRRGGWRARAPSPPPAGHGRAAHPPGARSWWPCSSM